MSSDFFEAFRPKREISETAQRALNAGIPVKVRKNVEYVYVNEATANFLDSPPAPYFAPLLCSCDQRPYPHELSVHAKLRSERPGIYSDFYDFAVQFAPPGMRWPWALKLSPREEPSTERKFT